MMRKAEVQDNVQTREQSRQLYGGDCRCWRFLHSDTLECTFSLSVRLFIRVGLLNFVCRCAIECESVLAHSADNFGLMC